MSNNPMGGLGGLLGSLFGQDTRQEDVQQFDDRYNSGRHQDLDNREVQQRYRQTLRNAPPEVIEDAHADAFEQLNPQQRRELAARLRQQASQLDDAYADPYDQDQDDDDDPRKLARMARQAEQRNPNILDQLFGNEQGPLSNPMVKMALAGAAAMAARRFLSGQQGGQASSPVRGSQIPSLGDLFGGQNTTQNSREVNRGGGFGGGGTEV